MKKITTTILVGFTCLVMSGCAKDGTMPTINKWAYETDPTIDLQCGDAIKESSLRQVFTGKRGRRAKRRLERRINNECKIEQQSNKF